MNSTSQNDFNRVNDLLQLWKERLAFLEREQAIKVVIPLIPAIASYELEMETEGLMYQAWKKIKGVVGR